MKQLCVGGSQRPKWLTRIGDDVVVVLDLLPDDFEDALGSVGDPLSVDEIMPWMVMTIDEDDVVALRTRREALQVVADHIDNGNQIVMASRSLKQRIRAWLLPSEVTNLYLKSDFLQCRYV